MNMIAQNQLEKLDSLYRNGQFEGIAPGELNKLTAEDILLFISEAEKVQPGVYTPVDDETRQELQDLTNRGLLQISASDLRYLTHFDAEAFLFMDLSSDKNHEHAASRSQRQRIKTLMDNRWLRRRSDWKILMLSAEQAEKLIRQGEAQALCGRKG